MNNLKQQESVHKLLDRFAFNIYTQDGTTYKYKDLKQVFALVEKGQDVYCNTISGHFLVATCKGLTAEIIRQAKMYADFGENN